jgi:hypothetical protein
MAVELFDVQQYQSPTNRTDFHQELNGKLGAINR